MLTLDDFHDYQHEARAFINEGAETYLLADVGKGKTSVILTALQDKLKAGIVKRALIAGPKKVAETVWHAEVGEWQHLQGLNVVPAVGNPAQRKKVIDSDAEIVVISYDNLNWFLANYSDAPPFDALVFDEIDMLSNVGSKRFKRLRFFMKKINTRIGCTATFTSTSLLNVWAQMYLLDGGEALGTSYTLFRSKYFYPTDFNQHDWAAFEHSENQILDRIGLITHRVTSDKGARLPPIERDIAVEHPEAVLKMTRKLSKDKKLVLPEGEIKVKNAATLAGKRLQIAAGFSYVTTYKGDQATVWHHKNKFDQIDKLLKRHEGEQVLLVYTFIAQAEELQKRYPDIPVKIASDVINSWNAAEINLAAGHPSSMSHGINLQRSGARVIILITPVWTNRLYQQIIGRLNRQGNPTDEIIVYRLISKDSEDETVLEVLHGREFNDDAYLKYLEA